MAQRTEDPRHRSGIIPRKSYDRTELQSLDRALQETQTAIRELREYSATISSRPVPTRAAQIDREAKRLLGILEKMKLESVPIFRERFDNEIDHIRAFIQQAKREGDIEKAWRQLTVAQEQLQMLGDVFVRSSKIIQAGLPDTYFIGPSGPEQTFTMLQDSAELAILELGGEQDLLARATLKGFVLVTQNFDIFIFDDSATAEEFRSATVFVTSKAAQLQAREEYTAQQQQEDTRTLAQFEHNFADIRRQVREKTLVYLEGMVASLVPAREMREASAAAAMDQYYRWRDETQELTKRLTRHPTALATYDEINRLTAGYFALSGRTDVPMGRERIEILRQSAQVLRGTGRESRIEEGTPAWFGLQALRAIDDNNRTLAALCIMVGQLDKTSLDRLREYLPTSYGEVMDIIRNKRTPSPGMLARMTAELQFGNIKAETDRLVADYPPEKRGEQNDRIREAAQKILERLETDPLGARRLLSMVKTYIDMIQTNGRRWDGSKEMEAALAIEIGGGNALQEFNASLVYHSFKVDSGRLNELLSDWGSGMVMQRKVIRDSLAQGERLAREGKAEQAAKVLMLLTMYIDGVEVIATRRGGQIHSLARSDVSVVRGMERALGAIVAGEEQVDGTEIEAVFMDSFNRAYSLNIQRESVRLEGLASTREFGREDITFAIQTARKRAERKDFEGAKILLSQVADFYGIEIRAIPAEGDTPAVEARKEGGRYDIFARSTVPGIVSGRAKMLEAIRLETISITATQHRTAADKLIEGIILVENTHNLMQGYQEILGVYRGERAVNEQTAAGKILIGEDQAGKKVYLDMADLRAYDTREGAEPRDPLLEAGRPLKDILRDIEVAARQGNIEGFNTAVTAYNLRFGRVVQATSRSQTYDQLVESLDALQVATSTVYGMYDEPPTHVKKVHGYVWQDGQVMRRQDVVSPARYDYSSVDTVDMPGGGWRTVGKPTLIKPAETVTQTVEPTIPTQVRDRLLVLERRRAELVARIEQVRHRGGVEESLLEDYRTLMADFRKEERLVTAYATVNGELKISPAYRSMAAQTSGPLDDLFEGATYETRGLLDRSEAELQKALDLIVIGDGERAMLAYSNGINLRISAMKRYGTETDIFVTVSIDSDAEMMASAFGHETLSDIINDRRREIVAGRDDQYVKYLLIHKQALREILFGDETPGRTDRIKMHGKRLEAARMIDIAMFSIPARNTSQSIANQDYAGRQDQVREACLSAAGAYRTGQSDLGEQKLAEAKVIVEQMEKWSGIIGFAGNAAYTVVALGVTVLQPEIGIPMILAQQADHAYTEYHVEGAVSATSWAMMGLTVVTVGLGSWVGSLGRGAVEAERLGQLATATRMLGRARAITMANVGIGIGMTGYMGYESYRAWQSGQYKEAVFTGMVALFPWAHMGGARYRAARVRSAETARAKAVDLEAVVEELAPAIERPAIEIEPTRVPEAARVAELRSPAKLLEFLRAYTRADPIVKESMMARIPEHARTVLGDLARNPAMTEALRAPDTSVTFLQAEEAMRAAIRGFERPPPTTPGPRNTGPLYEAANWLATRGVTLRDFVGDLVHGEALATARLEQIRSQNPEVARIVDRLVSNDFVRLSYDRGLNPASEAAFRKALTDLEAVVPKEILQVEVQAMEVYELQVVGGEPIQMMGRPPTMGERGAPIEGVTRTQIRASTDPPGGGGPVDGGGQVRPPTGGRSRLNVPGRVLDSYRGYREGRSARAVEAEVRAREGVTAPQDFATEASMGLERILDTARPSAERVTMDITDAQAVELANLRVVELFRTLYERSTSRDVPSALRTELARIMQKMYARENVRNVLREAAEGNVDIQRAIRSSEGTAAETIRRTGTTLEEHYRRLGVREEGKLFTETETGLILDTLEAPVIRMVEQARAAEASAQRTRVEVEGQIETLRPKLARAETSPRESYLRGADKAVETAIEQHGALTAERESYGEIEVLRTELRGLDATNPRAAELTNQIARIEALDASLGYIQERLGTVVDEIAFLRETNLQRTSPRELLRTTQRIGESLQRIQRELGSVHEDLGTLGSQGIDVAPLGTARTAWDKAIRKPLKTLEGYNTRLEGAERTIYEATQQIQDARNQPLVATEGMLATRFGETAKAEMFARLLTEGKMREPIIEGEARGLQYYTERTIADLSADSQAAQVAQQRVLERVARGGNADEILLGVLKSEPVMEALGRKEAAYREALSDAKLDLALEEWNSKNPRQQRTKVEQAIEEIRGIDSELADFATEVRGFSDNFNALGKYAEALTNYRSNPEVAVPEYGSAGVDAWHWAKGRVPTGLISALDYILPVRGWGRGGRLGPLRRRGMAIREDAIRSGELVEGSKRAWGTALVVAQFGLWAADVALMEYWWGRKITGDPEQGPIEWTYGTISECLFQTKSITEGRRLIKEKFDVDISEDNAKAIIKDPNVRMFVDMLPYIYPKGDERRPQNLEEAMQREGGYIHPAMVDRVLDDVREMSGQIDDINDYVTRINGNDDPDRKYEGKLRAIIEPWGISYDQLIGRARIKKRDTGIDLEMMDLVDLRKTGDWVDKGYAFTFGSAIVSSFLYDCGVTDHQREFEVFTQNADVYDVLWTLMKSGKVPYGNAQMAASMLAGTGVIERLRLKAEIDEKKLSVVVEEFLSLNEMASGGKKPPRDVTQASFLLSLSTSATAEGAFSDKVHMFLNQDRDAFVALWNLVHNGSLPVVYSRDAIIELSKPGVIAGIRTGLQGEQTLEEGMYVFLREKGWVLEIPEEQEGQTRGLSHNAILGYLDREAMTRNPALETTVREILTLYKGDPDALRALDSLTLDANEAVYGDLTEFATWIVTKTRERKQLFDGTPERERGKLPPFNLKAEAQREGWILRASYGDIDPQILEHRDLLTFAQKNPLIMTWIEGKRDIGYGINLVAVLRYLELNKSSLPTEQQALTTYLDSLMGQFESRKLMRANERVPRTPEAARRHRAQQSGQKPSQQVRDEEELRRHYPKWATLTPVRTAAPRTDVSTVSDQELTGFMDSMEGLKIAQDIEASTERQKADPDIAALIQRYKAPGVSDADALAHATREITREIYAEILRAKTVSQDKQLYERGGIKLTFAEGGQLTITLDEDKSPAFLGSRIKAAARRAGQRAE
ncbi:MAG: hypothetical protein ABH842_04470 [Candidatus Micrarchaeota archaeon]